MMLHLRGYPVSASTYGNHGCRCAGCRAEWAAASRRWRRAYVERHPEKEAERLERVRAMRKEGLWK